MLGNHIWGPHIYHRYWKTRISLLVCILIAEWNIKFIWYLIQTNCQNSTSKIKLRWTYAMSVLVEVVSGYIRKNILVERVPGLVPSVPHPLSSTLQFNTKGPLLFSPKKFLSSARKTPQFNTPLVLHQKPLSSTPKTNSVQNKKKLTKNSSM